MKLPTSLIVSLAMATAVLFQNAADIQSAPPNYLNYQGRIKQGGKAITGDRFFEFKITNSDGSQVYWTSGSTKVWVAGGLFRYVLGPLDNVNFKDIEPYLEIKVGDTSPDTLMLPREKLVSSIYAIYSSSASYSYQTLNATFLSNRPYEAFVSTRAENQTIAGVKIFTSTTVFQGNVGIGTTTPSQKLHIQGSVTPGTGLLVMGNIGGGVIADFRYPGTGAGGIQTSGYSDGSKYATLYNLDDTTLRISKTDGTNTGSIYITSSGWVGLRNAIPSYPVDAGGSRSSDYSVRLINSYGGSSSHGVAIWAGDGGSGTTANLIGFHRNDGVELGRIRKTGTNSVAYETTSDIRLKENIRDTHYRLDDLMKIQVRDFNWRDDKSKITHTGFIAQELYEIYPEAVYKPEDENKERWSVDYGKLTPLIIQTLKELKNKNDELKEKIKSLENLIYNIKKPE